MTLARRYGEADRLLILLTRERGRLSAVAKSARKPKSSLRGATEPFVRARFELAEGRSLAIVRQTEIIDAHLAIRGSWARLQLAGHIAEIANKMGEEHVPDAELYQLVAEALEGINGGLPDAVLRFKTALLDHLGIFPALTGCARCGKGRVKGDVHLDSSRFGFLCSECAGELGLRNPIPMRVLHILHAFRNQQHLLETVDMELLEKADETVTELIQAFLQAGLKTASAARKAFAAERDREKEGSSSADNKTGLASG